MPRYEPQLPAVVSQPPEGDRWVHEIEYAGYRAGCRVEGRTVSLLGGDGKDWTSAFPEICEAALGLGVREMLLDGEIAVLLPDGRTSVDALERVSDRVSRRRIVYLAFDLLFAGGESFVQRPLEERKRELLRLVGGPHSKSRNPVLGARHRPRQRLLRRGLPSWSRRDRLQTCGLPLHQRTKRRMGANVLCPSGIGRHRTRRDSSAVSSTGRRGDVILRPLARCPEGIGSPCHYMKHSKVWAPPALRRVSIQEKTKIGQYLIADTLPALISLVQMDILEITRGTRVSTRWSIRIGLCSTWTPASSRPGCRSLRPREWSAGFFNPSISTASPRLPAAAGCTSSFHSRRASNGGRALNLPGHSPRRWRNTTDRGSPRRSQGRTRAQGAD